MWEAHMQEWVQTRAEMLWNPAPRVVATFLGALDGEMPSQLKNIAALDWWKKRKRVHETRFPSPPL
jgi:hypothetical protein